MNVIFFDDDGRQNLLPLTATRPSSEIRIGILRIREKWELLLKAPCSWLAEEYLAIKFPILSNSPAYFINGRTLPGKALLEMITNLQPGDRIMSGETLVAGRFDGHVNHIKSVSQLDLPGKSFSLTDIRMINHSWDVFSMNEQEISNDFELLTAGRKSQPPGEDNTIINAEKIFIEDGAKVQCSILNASAGPIYIGKDAEVMEGSMIRGPFSLGEHSQVKMGAKIYGGTTIGPHSKVGGEISKSVIFGFSNKAHDGFLGNSVLGEWCNLGADTNNSNLKNNYSKIKLWDYRTDDYINTELQFCGLIMGDHSKCSINTMFNTGTVVGVSANIFGNGFPPKFIPSFSWGGAEGFKTYRLEDALEVASRVYERRGISFDAVEQSILKTIFESSTKYRSW